MLDVTLGLLLVPPLGAAGLVGVSRKAREIVCRQRRAARVAAFGGLLTVTVGAVMSGAGAQLVRGLGVALLAGAVWIPFARARGWGSRSTLPRRFDWGLFETQLRAYVEYSARRGRRQRDSGP
jgi:hypothetical protein